MPVVKIGILLAKICSLLWSLSFDNLVSRHIDNHDTHIANYIQFSTAPNVTPCSFVLKSRLTYTCCPHRDRRRGLVPSAASSFDGSMGDCFSICTRPPSSWMLQLTLRSSRYSNLVDHITLIHRGPTNFIVSPSRSRAINASWRATLSTMPRQRSKERLFRQTMRGVEPVEPGRSWPLKLIRSMGSDSKKPRKDLAPATPSSR